MSFPLVKEGPEGQVDAGLDLVAEDLKVEEDLDALHEPASIPCLEGVLEPLHALVVEFLFHTCQQVELLLDLGDLNELEVRCFVLVGVEVLESDRETKRVKNAPVLEVVGISHFLDELGYLLYLFKKHLCF